MSERTQTRRCNESATCPLISNKSKQSKLLNKNSKSLMLHPPLIQAKLAISQPGDKYEQEADRIAEAVVYDSQNAGAKSISVATSPLIQRQEQPKPEQSSDEKLKKSAEKTGEAFLKTGLGREIKEKALKMGMDFIETLYGKVITGAVAVSTITLLAATNSELPMQPPEIPLDIITPGLKVKLTYEGPVQNPKAASITFIFEENVRSEEKKGMTEAEKSRSENARIAADQERFREGLKSPEQRAKEKAQFERAFWGSRNRLGLKPFDIPGLRLEDEWLQRKEADNSPTDSFVPPIVHEVLSSPGQPLDSATRAFMEPRFGYDFSRVRIHTDSKAAESARAVNARAYTIGREIAFGAGSYAPETKNGRHLLAHELTHTIQQDRMYSWQMGMPELNQSGDGAETEADSSAVAVRDGRGIGKISKTPLHIARKPDTSRFKTGQYVVLVGPGKLEQVHLLSGICPNCRKVATLNVGSVLQVNGLHPGGSGMNYDVTVVKTNNENNKRKYGNIFAGWIRPADEATVASIQSEASPAPVEAETPQVSTPVHVEAETSQVSTDTTEEVGKSQSVSGREDDQNSIISKVINDIGDQILGSLGFTGPSARISKAALRGLVEEMHTQLIHGGKGGLFIARMATFSSKDITQLAGGYWSGLVEGIASPITDLFGFAEFGEHIKEIVKELPLTIISKRDKLAEEFKQLLFSWTWIQGALQVALSKIKEQPEKVLETMLTLPDTLSAQAEKMAYNIGRSGGSEIVKSLEEPWSQEGKVESTEPEIFRRPLGWLSYQAGAVKASLINTPWLKIGNKIGYAAGFVAVQAVLLLFTDGIGNTLVEVGNALGKVSKSLRVLATSVKEIGTAIASLEKLIGVGIGKLLKPLDKILEPVLKPFNEFLERLKNLLKELLGVAEEEAKRLAPGVASTAARDLGALDGGRTQPTIPNASRSAPKSVSGPAEMQVVPPKVVPPRETPEVVQTPKPPKVEPTPKPPEVKPTPEAPEPPYKKAGKVTTAEPEASFADVSRELELESPGTTVPKNRKNVYPDFEIIPQNLQSTAVDQAQRLGQQLGIPIPQNRVLSAPWVGRVGGTSMGLLRNESRFWSTFKRSFPNDYKLLGPNHTVSPKLAQRYGWPDNVIGDKLIHHHIENGQFVVAIPQSLHRQLSGTIHAKPTVVGIP